MPTILIVEDEPELVRVLRSYLEKSNFQVISTGRGQEGLALWASRKPDLVLLDLNLPEMDGLDIAREIRRQAQTPIIMLTARVEETDRLIGLELGSDDYITKPFSPREVVARVRAVLRRSSQTSPQASEILRIANIEIDLVGHSVQAAGRDVELTPTEFSILAALAGQPGRAFSRSQLLDLAQGISYEGYERTIDAHIKNLRAKLEPDPHKPMYIQTVFGIGYRFMRPESPLEENGLSEG